ncbi:MAG: hypothetical protein H7061_09795 [Bdellovibrionaceae bacterium]|nr:hypothetical protein [Bdellovibrio sp.]
MADKKAKTGPVKSTKPRPATLAAPQKFKDFTITQKRSGRFQVVTAQGAPVNGAEKEKLLLDAKVLKGSFKKAGEAAAPEATT